MQARSLRLGDGVILQRSTFAGGPAVKVMHLDGRTQLGTVERDAACQVDQALASGRLQACVVVQVLRDVDRARAGDEHGELIPQSVVSVRVTTTPVLARG
jgi:hypothetical protein